MTNKNKNINKKISYKGTSIKIKYQQTSLNNLYIKNQTHFEFKML